MPRPAACRTYTPPPAWLESQGVGQALGLLLILRAFAAGSVALTGTEAVSNGVPAFRPPEARNARDRADPDGTSLRHDLPGHQLPGRRSWASCRTRPSRRRSSARSRARWSGAGTPFHYLIQFSTALLLVLAANTAFADFPRLASILGKDRFLPRQFQFRGDRLAFTSGSWSWRSSPAC